MFERRLIYHLDWLMIVALAALCAIGVVMIYSTTHLSVNPRINTLYVRQFYAIAIGVVAMVCCLSIDYRTLADNSLAVYLLVVALLVAVLLFGTTGGGARRWISLPFFNLQPSEFAKIGVALTLAKFFDESRRGAPSLTDVGIAGALTLVPVLLIARQPDLGTAVSIAMIFLAMAYLAGMRLRLLVVLLLVAAVTAPVVWRYALKDYQRSRISTFVDPGLDARGAGYQQIQARISVGAGGPWGAGFMKGTQGQLRFMPLAWNDFVFSVYAEEQGFMGVIVALGLYLFVIVRALDTARIAKDRLGAHLVLGVLAAFGFQVIYNITMSAGLAPVKGLTLPLMSSGGSSMIATLAGFGLILNVRMRRFTN